MKYVRHIGLIIKQSVFFVISAIIPKDKKLWLFGAWQGRTYSDNSKQIFEYINDNDKSICCVWLSSNQDVIQSIREKGYNAVLINSWKAKWLLLRASVVFETEGNRDVGGHILCRTNIVQLWHGVAPKRMDWSSRTTCFQKWYMKHFIDNHQTSRWMVSSEHNKMTMQSLFGLADENIFITGYPRNDIFSNVTEISDVRKDLDELYPNCKKVIYMPTHRNFGTSGAEFSEKDMLELDEKLRYNNIVMVFKPHFHELKNYLHLESSFTNIVLAKDSKYSDVYSYIKDFDLLISDYSSIIYDFTCSKKPIVLFPYDLEKFKNTDAGLFDYFETIPAGPFCYTWDEVVNNVVDLLTNDSWKEKREICRLTFHPFDDGKNCERVYNAVVNKIL